MAWGFGTDNFNYKHGLGYEAANNRLYRIWYTAKRTAKLEKVFFYEPWNDFRSFYRDIAPLFYGKKHHKFVCFLRKDRNAGYFPDNCYFGRAVDKKARYKKRFISYQGKTHTMREWSRLTHINANTIQKRLSLGWTVEEALTLERFPYGMYLSDHKKQKENITPKRKIEEKYISDGSYRKALLQEVKRGRMTKKGMKEALEDYQENRGKFNSLSLQLAVQTNLKLRPKGINKKGYQFGINRQGI